MLLTGTLFPLFLVPSVLASCAPAVSPQGTISCYLLRSICFHRLLRYYEAVRLLPYRQVLSVCKTSIPLTVFTGVWQTSQVCRYYLAHSPRSMDPDGTCITSRLRLSIAACDQGDGIGFRSISLTGLNRFTLAHCGSRAPLPTLKPHLTAPAPRLSTGCSLRFAGFGLSPNDIICTELAHPLLI